MIIMIIMIMIVIIIIMIRRSTLEARFDSYSGCNDYNK